MSIERKDNVNEFMPSNKSVRTIRLDDNQIARILDDLDTAGAKSRPERRGQRYPYRMKAVVVHMQQPGSNVTVPFLDPTRNISEGGLSVLHGGFVHPGTRCTVQLVTRSGTWDYVDGSVVSCHYIQANIHEVSIRFDYTIDPSLYCSAAVQSRVLLAEDEVPVARLATFHLEKLNAEVDHAPNGHIAVEKALDHAYDVILMDMEMPVLDGFQAVAQLRKRGYTGLIVAAATFTQPDDAKRCLEVGCDKCIAKPVSKEMLEEIIRSLREEPLISTLCDDLTMADMIDSYVRDLPTKVRTMEAAMADRDVESLASILRTLKGEGTSYGFAVITEAAQKIESALVRESSTDGLETDLRALLKLCMQARTSARRRTKVTPGESPS